MTWLESRCCSVLKLHLSYPSVGCFNKVNEILPALDSVKCNSFCLPRFFYYFFICFNVNIMFYLLHRLVSLWNAFKLETLMDGWFWKLTQCPLLLVNFYQRQYPWNVVRREVTRTTTVIWSLQLLWDQRSLENLWVLFVSCVTRAASEFTLY